METGQLRPSEAYKVALDTRNSEINLFWQRSNYFLVLNTGLAIGFFNLQNKQYSRSLAVLGAVVSVLWYSANLGSKFWRSRWEHRLKIIEEQIAPGLNFFAAGFGTGRIALQRPGGIGVCGFQSRSALRRTNERL